MSLCEEDLFDTDKKVEDKIKLLQRLQIETPAAFLVGTIEKVSQKISDLDEELSKYDSQLVIESRSPAPDRLVTPRSVSFSPTTSLHHTALSTRLSSDALTDVYSKKTTVSTAKKSDAPRLVELQQYPGWNKKVHTPLPHGLETTIVLDHVVAAQSDLRRKPAYREEFRRLLYSKVQQYLLQDAFWWFFLEKFHPDVGSQSKLFQRISNSFVTLLLSAETPNFRNIFFSSFGSILAQSIYSAFCMAYPQSWRQFDEPSFKELLARVCGEWVSGIPPPPESFEKWHTQALEPDGMRKEEVIKKKKKPDHSKHLFSGGRSSAFSSTASTKTSTGRTLSGSNKPRGIRQLTAKSDAMSSGTSPKLTPRVAELASEHTLLTPITEEPLASASESVSGVKSRHVNKDDNSSCMAGHCMDFTRNVFNVFGRSPLLAQFALQYGFGRMSYYDVLIHHPLLQTPAKEGAKTYKDVIAESKQNASRATKEFRRLHDENEKMHHTFSVKQKEEYRAFWEKAEKLLSKPRQVHYLSNIILQEMKNDQEDTNPVGAAAALQAALLAESGTK